MNHIVVIGSLNLDLETEVNRFPKAGETLLGSALQMHCGGKGNNQAIAAAKLDAPVTMIGAIGNDHFGRILENNLKKHHVNTDFLLIRDEVPTATALITRTQKDNTIIVTEGANNTLSPQDILNATDCIARHDILLIQQEIPLETQIQAIETGYQLQKTIILNPAPMRPLPLEVLKKVSFLIPNEHEIMGLELTQNQSQEAEEIIRACPVPIIMTWGEKGILFKNENQQVQHLPTYAVQCLDTTGAGDTFCGAFCTFLHTGFETALRKALQASAISVTRSGAQNGMPTLQELENYVFDC